MLTPLPLNLEHCSLPFFSSSALIVLGENYLPYHNTLKKMNNEVSRYVVFMSMLQLAFHYTKALFLGAPTSQLLSATTFSLKLNFPELVSKLDDE